MIMAAAKKPTNLADFKAQFDPTVVIPNKIKAALASLLKEGKEAWEFEQDFLKRANLAPPHLAQYRTDFEKHIVRVRERGRNERTVWFADQKVATEARGE
jgi:hypothetical protein